MPEQKSSTIDSLENEIISRLEEKDSDNEKEIFELVQQLELLYFQGIGEGLNELIDRPFIEYLVSDKDIYLLSNIGGLQVHRLKSTSQVVQAKVNTALKGILSKSAILDKELNQLYSILVPLPLNGISSLTIIPDSYLVSLPFDLLMMNGQFLIEKMPISYFYQNEKIPSRKPSAKKMDLFCLIPDYTQGGTELVSLERNASLPLAYVEDEILMLESLDMFDSEVLRSMEVKKLRGRIETCDVFHFGGHAIADQSNSYLSLVGEEGIIPLYAHQLEYFPNKMKLACLSACETGVGRLVQGEGVRSLASSFLSSGTEAVLYSLWKVNDKSTSQVMKTFYSGLGNGLNKDEALRKAKLEYINRADPTQINPYYWAAFCLMGDNRSIVTSADWNGAILFGAFVILGIVLTLTLTPWKTR